MRKPVFVDHTGRRRRAAIVLGSGLGVLLVVGLIMLAAGMLSGAPVRLPGWPDTAQGEGTVPTPAAVVQPTSTRAPVAKPTTSVPAPQPTVTATGPGNGNGNGHGGRPSKTPGKP